MIPALASLVFALAGIVALASIAQSARGLFAAWRALVDERDS